MYIFTTISFCLVCAFLIVLLRQIKPELAVALSVMSAGIVLTVVVISTTGITDAVINICTKASFSPDNIKVLIKALGICYITGLAKDCGVDCGESALASKIDLAGRVSICAMSLPLFSQILDFSVSLLK